ncbi:MAG: preQ(1) synthase [bacterium]|nr:preQ(1) synthase [bacterium]
MVEALSKKLPFDGYEKIAPQELEVFAYEYVGKRAEVVIETEEFSAVCPFSGLPDYGTLRIRYVPDKVCIELRSLKYYLLSYRTVGIYQEHAAQRILGDLVACSQPVEMTVELEYKVRGGIKTVVTVSYPEEVE